MKMKRKFSFSGRSSRGEYWLGVAALYLYYTIAFVGAFIIALGMTIRRLHDVGKSGWWILLGLVPFIGDIILFLWLARPSDDNN